MYFDWNVLFSLILLFSLFFIDAFLPFLSLLILNIVPFFSYFPVIFICLISFLFILFLLPWDNAHKRYPAIRVPGSYVSPSFCYSAISWFLLGLLCHNKMLLSTKSRGITNRMRIFLTHICYMLRSYSYIRIKFVQMADVTVGQLQSNDKGLVYRYAIPFRILAGDIHCYRSEETGVRGKIAQWVVSQCVFFGRCHESGPVTEGEAGGSCGKYRREMNV
jgi:hypothetical protein